MLWNHEQFTRDNTHAHTHSDTLKKEQEKEEENLSSVSLQHFEPRT